MVLSSLSCRVTEQVRVVVSPAMTTGVGEDVRDIANDSECYHERLLHVMRDMAHQQQQVEHNDYATHEMLS